MDKDGVNKYYTNEDEAGKTVIENVKNTYDIDGIEGELTGVSIHFDQDDGNLDCIDLDFEYGENQHDYRRIFDPAVIEPSDEFIQPSIIKNRNGNRQVYMQNSGTENQFTERTVKARKNRKK
jgi:hypothetical protein